MQWRGLLCSGWTIADLLFFLLYSPCLRRRFVCLFVWLFVCLFVCCLSFCLFVCFFVCLFCLFVCLLVCLLRCLSVCLFVGLVFLFLFSFVLLVCSSVCSVACLLVCLFVCVFVCLLCWAFAAPPSAASPPLPDVGVGEAQVTLVSACLHCSGCIPHRGQYCGCFLLFKKKNIYIYIHMYI